MKLELGDLQLHYSIIHADSFADQPLCTTLAQSLPPLPGCRPYLLIQRRLLQAFVPQTSCSGDNKQATLERPIDFELFQRLIGCHHGSSSQKADRNNLRL